MLDPSTRKATTWQSSSQKEQIEIYSWRGGRVVDCGGLENR